MTPTPTPSPSPTPSPTPTPTPTATSGGSEFEYVVGLHGGRDEFLRKRLLGNI